MVSGRRIALSSIKARGFSFPEIRVYSWSPMTSAEIRQSSSIFSARRAHHRAVVLAAAGLAEPALHQCRHESVRADLPRPDEMPPWTTAARRRHAEMHSRRRQTQRSRRRRPRHLSPHVLRDARQLVLRRLLQERSHRLGLGTRGRMSGNFRRNGSTPRSIARTTRAIRASSIRRPTTLGAIFRAAGSRSRGSHRQRQQEG